jgi:predicted DNA binding protein
MIDECLMTEFRVEGDDCPLAAATREAGVAVDAAPPLSRADGTVLLRFSAPPAGALVAVLDDDDRVRYLHRAEAGGRHTCRCLSLHPCVVHELVDAGLMVESLRYSDGTLLVLAAAGRTVGATLERAYTMRPDDDDPVEARWDLTPAQAESLQRALGMGYFRVPRGATAGEVAEALDISKTAFLERLRRAQASVFAAMFPDASDRGAAE